MFLHLSETKKRNIGSSLLSIELNFHPPLFPQFEVIPQELKHTIPMIIKKNFLEHSEVQTNTLKTLEHQISKSAKMISKSLKNNGLVIWCGNGGSASDSMHISAELLGRFKKNRKSLRSISLAGDSTSITCISNDFGYENLFSRQLEGLAGKNDIYKSRRLYIFM